jgi:predicted O-linked N-acetylglucosamine transferase (SPINDLY family)
MSKRHEIQQIFEQATAHHRAGRVLEAEKLYRQVLAQQPNHAGTIHMIARLAMELGRTDAAIALLERAIKIAPAAPDYHADRARALRSAGRLDEAADACNRAIALRPDSAHLHNDLGNVLLDARRIPRAIDAFRRAIALNPDFLEAANNLGNALMKLGAVDQAIAAYRDAIRLQPDLAESHANLASALKDTGQLDQALSCYRRAEDLKPDPHIAGARLYAIHLHPEYNPRRILEEHVRWNDRYAQPLTRSIRPHQNDRNRDRKLRIGYASGDLNDHPVGRFMLPLLPNHDREQFEIFCYSDTRRQDATTARLRGAASQWRITLALSDEQLAALVRQDAIDILVDLTMHAHGSRLLAFARKPAPVQVTYLAYCSTTGLETMDWRLTDPHLDPAGTDAFCTERSIRLPRSYWCYSPPAEAGPTRQARRQTNSITFACLNNFAKVSQPALDCWAAILKRVEPSRLILHIAEGEHRRRILDFFAQRGISQDCITFVERAPLAQYFAQYHQVDIALDTFPFAGATTTCDALWMGVPVVSLAGDTAVGRSGLSILSNVGLPDLVARSPDQYISIATALALDRPRFTEISRSLRQRMLDSPLMNASAFARDIEAAFRQTWRAYCASS